MLSRRTILGPTTGVFQTPVKTVLPRHSTLRGRPTFTEVKVAKVLTSPVARRFSGSRRHRQSSTPIAAVRGDQVIGENDARRFRAISRPPLPATKGRHGASRVLRRPDRRP